MEIVPDINTQKVRGAVLIADAASEGRALFIRNKTIALDFLEMVVFFWQKNSDGKSLRMILDILKVVCKTWTRWLNEMPDKRLAFWLYETDTNELSHVMIGGRRITKLEYLKTMLNGKEYGLTVRLIRPTQPITHFSLNEPKEGTQDYCYKEFPLKLSMRRIEELLDLPPRRVDNDAFFESMVLLTTKTTDLNLDVSWPNGVRIVQLKIRYNGAVHKLLPHEMMATLEDRFTQLQDDLLFANISLPVIY